MRYDKYYKKTMAMANVLKFFKRFRVIFITLLSLGLLSFVVCMSIFGMVYDVIDCPTNLQYGESLQYSSGSIFGDVWYEYAPIGSDEWTTEVPTGVGEYQVRGVSRSVAGQLRYGDTHVYTISPKPLDVYVNESVITYGDKPTLTADLEYNDTIACDDFVYEDYASTSTSVTPIKESITIYNDDGVDVTNNYDINCVEKDITFNKRPITIVVGNYDGTYIYDGQRFSFDQYEISQDTPIAFDETVIATFSDYLINAGVISNEPSIKIMHDGKDVTLNYDVTVQAGTLSVEKRPIYISTSSLTKIYDGATLLDMRHEITGGVLVDGHTLSVVTSQSIVNAGSADNLMQFKIVDNNGVDVTNNYSIFCELGTLEVQKRPITIITNDNKWTYDGNAHTDNTYWLSDDSSCYGLVSGHLSVGSDVASITNNGSVANEMVIGIFNGSVDVTANYDITYDYGTLKVDKRPITIATNDNNWIYDGTKHNDNTHWVSDDSQNLLVEGHKTKVDKYATIIDFGTQSNQLIISIIDGEIDVTANYDISYNYGTLSIEKRAISIISNDKKIYDGEVFESNNIQVVLSTELAYGHTITATTIHTEYEDKNAYIGIGEWINTIVDDTVVVCDASGNDVTGNYTISPQQGVLTIEKRPITFSTCTNTWVYDDIEHSDGTHQVSEDSEYALVDGHTSVSSAWTSVLSVGIVDNEMIINVLDGEDDVTANYDITYDYGTLEISKRPIILVSSSEKMYDGYDFAYSDVEVMSSVQLVDNHTISIDTEHKQYDANLHAYNFVGEWANVIIKDSVVILNASQQDVTSNYAITLNEGVLKITSRPIVINTITNKWIYNDIEYSDGTHEVSDNSNYALCDNHTSESSALTTILEVGKVDNEMVVDVYDDNLRVTDNYTITYEYGTLEVEPRPIKVVTTSNSWMYDDIEHSDGAHSLSVEGDYLDLVDEHKSVSNNLTTIINVGTLDNEMSIAIVKGNKDVTSNYAITYEYGMLEVTKRPITIISNSQKIYDDILFEYNGVQLLSSITLVNGHSISVDTLHKQYDSTQHSYVDVGEWANIIDEQSIVIVNGKEKDVTQNYAVTCNEGVLKIELRDITFLTATNSWIYDDTAHSDGNHVVSENSQNSIADTHVSSSSNLTSITDVGKVDNEMTITIANAQRDVTHNYTIHYEYGTLEIKKRPIKIVTADNSWVYDGEIHSDLNHEVVEEGDYYSIVDGHTTSPMLLTTVQNVCEVKNDVGFAILRGNIDVTKNYEIDKVLGTLSVTPRPITIISSSQKVYDDVLFEYNDIQVTSSIQLVEGHSISADTEHIEYEDEYAYINVGNWKNLIIKDSVEILDAANRNVTTNYEVTRLDGTLTIEKRAVKFDTASNSWVYDGEVHSDGTHKLSEDSEYALVEGHVSVVDTLSEITNVGSIENVFDIIILDGKVNVTDNYLMTFNNGTLKVTQRPITIESSSQKIYDGIIFEYNGIQVVSSIQLVEGHSISADTEHIEYAMTQFEYIDVGEWANVIVEDSEVIVDGKGNDVTSNYAITRNQGILTIDQRPITFTTATNSWVYDDTSHSDATHQVGEDSEYDLVDGHISVANNLSTITEVGSVKNVMTISILEDKRDVSFNYTIDYNYGTLSVTARPITVETASNSWVYDGEVHSDSNYVVYNLVEGHTSEAIDVREVVDVCEVDNTMTLIVYKGKNDVTHNYDIHYEHGTLEIEKRSVKFATASNSWVYDGNAHSDRTHGVSEDSPYQLVEGHTTTASEVATIVEVGSVKNTMVVSIWKGTIDVTDNYAITYQFGNLEVTKLEITIVANDEKMYDGVIFESNVIQTVLPTALVEGHSITAQTEHVAYDNEFAYINVGEWNNLIVKGTEVITDASGNDVTQNYEISRIAGTLKITPRPITIEANDKKVYDGELFESSRIEIVSEIGLANNQTIVGQTKHTTYDDEFAYINVGDWINIIIEGSIIISDSKGNDVTSNYLIQRQNGILKIIPRPITIVTATNSWVYDGTIHSDGTYWVSENSEYDLVFGHTTTASESVTIIEPGKIANEMTITIYHGDIEKTENYNISYEYGTLEVKKIKLTISTSSASKVYDGTPLTKDEWTLQTEPSPILSWHELDVKVTGTITDIGVKPNVFEVRIFNGEEDVTDKYYEINRKEGLLEILNPDLTGGVTDGGNSGGSGEGGGEGSGEGGSGEGGSGEGGSGTGGSGEGGSSGSGGSGGLGGGDIGGSGGGEFDQDAPVTVKVLTDIDDHVYLRYWSYGDYTGTSWNYANEYSGLINDEYSLNYLTSFALSESGMNAHSIKIQDISGLYYYLPYYASTSLGVPQTSDVYSSGDATGIYELKYYSYDYRTDGAVSGSSVYSQQEQAYYSWVISNYMSVPESTAEYLDTIILEKGWTSSDNNIISTVASYVQSSAKYDLNYAENLIDGKSLDDSQDMVVSFLRDYKTGVCRHYASSAVLLYRELGIPARYVVGYVGETTAGEWAEITSNQAHAWVEVYVKGLGWVQVEVTGGGPGGESGGSGGVGGGSGEGETTPDGGESGGSGEGGSGEGGSGEGGSGEGGGSGVPDGGDIGGGGIIPDGSGGLSSIAVKVYTESAEDLYLRYTTFGDYTGTGWGTANEYSSLIDNTYSANYLTSFGLGEMGMNSKLIKIEVVGGGYYLVPYYANTLIGHIQTSDVTSSGDASSIYELNYYSYDYCRDGSISGSAQYSEFEMEYYNWVVANYLSVPQSTAEYLDTIIANNDWNANDINIISKVANYVRNSATYDLKYAQNIINGKNLDESEDMVVSFLRDYKTGVCRHYASAGTLLFRQLGIPARYVTGFTTTTKADEWTEVTVDKAHAWVEVYIQGLGWVQVEVTGGSSAENPDEGEDDGDDTTLPTITIYPYVISKTYDGKPLQYKADDYDYLMPEGYEDYTLELDLSVVKRTEAGSVNIKKIRQMFINNTYPWAVYDTNGEDVTDKFTLTFMADINNVLTILQREIVITTGSAEKVYDGTALTNNSYSVSGNGLVSYQDDSGNTITHQMDVTLNTSIVDVGSIDNEISGYRIWYVGEFGNKVYVTDNYKITSISGKLTVLED